MSYTYSALKTIYNSGIQISELIKHDVNYETLILFCANIIKFGVIDDKFVVNLENKTKKTQNDSKAWIDDCNYVIAKINDVFDSDIKFDKIRSAFKHINDVDLSDVNNIKNFIIASVQKYSDRVQFPSSIVGPVNFSVANPYYKASRFSVNRKTAEVVIDLIEEWAKGLLVIDKNDKGFVKSNSDKTPQIVIHNSNSNNANATSNVSIDINVDFQIALSKLDDACLNEDEDTEVREMLNKILNISNSNNSKKGKWEQIKDVVSWVTSKSIQIASIALPFVSSILQHIQR